MGWTDDEAVRAGLSIIAHSETFTVVTEDEKSVIDPIAVSAKILADTQSRLILGAHAIGRHAADLVNTAAFAMSTGTTIDDLGKITFVHQSAAETIQALATKF